MQQSCLPEPTRLFCREVLKLQPLSIILCSSQTPRRPRSKNFARKRRNTNLPQCVSTQFMCPWQPGLLARSPVQVCTVVGFPLGASLVSYKLIEALGCMQAGASEIDMVINIGALKGEAFGMVLNEMEALAQAAHNQGAILKVIIETALLTPREKIIACLISKEAGADFVKTSTGFASAGATVPDVELMRSVVGADLGVKAAGGVRTLADALGMIQAGATRIGSSAGVQIVREALA